MSQAARVVIVGAGFSGLAMAIRLRQEGIDDFVVLERADRSRRDMAAQHLPRLPLRRSVAPVLVLVCSNPEWSQTYSPQPEIRDYLRRWLTIRDSPPHASRASRSRRAPGQRPIALGDRDQPRAPHRRGPDHRRRTADRAQAARCPRLGVLRRQDDALRPLGPRYAGGKRVASIGTGASAIQYVPGDPTRSSSSTSSSAPRPGSCPMVTARSPTRALALPALSPARSWFA